MVNNFSTPPSTPPRKAERVHSKINYKTTKVNKNTGLKYVNVPTGTVLVRGSANKYKDSLKKRKLLYTAFNKNNNNNFNSATKTAEKYGPEFTSTTVIKPLKLISMHNKNVRKLIRSKLSDSEKNIFDYAYGTRNNISPRISNYNTNNHVGHMLKRLFPQFNGYISNTIKKNGKIYFHPEILLYKFNSVTPLNPINTPESVVRRKKSRV